MTLKELARQYHYGEIKGCKDQLIFNIGVKDLAKALRSFNTYITYFKKQDYLK